MSVVVSNDAGEGPLPQGVRSAVNKGDTLTNTGTATVRVNLVTGGVTIVPMTLLAGQSTPVTEAGVIVVLAA